MKKVLWTCKILRNEDNSGNIIQGLKMNLGIYEHELDDENRDLLRKLRFPDQTRVRCPPIILNVCVLKRNNNIVDEVPTLFFTDMDIRL